MPELTNESTGVTVSASEAVARVLGAEWSSGEKAEPEKKPAKRTRKNT